MKLKPLDKGWIAGIIDGEGCFLIHRTKTPNRVNKYKYSPELYVCNSEKEIIDKCYELTKIGNVHKRKGRKEGYRDQWIWTVTPRPLRQLIPQIKKALIKKDQAEIILRALKINKYRGSRKGVWGAQKKRPLKVDKELQELYHMLRNLKSG